jgi:hypothetical protein
MQRDAGFSISGPIFKVQAEKFAMQLEYKDCSCGNGCLYCFKNWNNIVYAEVNGKALLSDMKTASEFIANCLGGVQGRIHQRINL